MRMDPKGFIVPPGDGSILTMAPGRSAVLKLLGGDTGNSIMLFEETAPAGTETTFHLHRESDEVAYVLSGEITFKIGHEITVGRLGTCAFLPRGGPTRLEKYRHRNRPRAVSVYASRCRRVF